MSFRRSLVVGALTGLMLGAAFAAGFFARDVLGSPGVAIAAAASGESYPLLDEVQVLLDRHYLREQPDYTQRQYAAVRGLLGSLGDRYTFFIEPPVAQSESDVLAGTYGGIGVQLQRSETGEFVLFPFPESPARAAGVQDGDFLVAVNDMPIEVSMQQDAVDQLLRGEVNGQNGVQITAQRASTREAYTVFITFDVINVPSVIWRIIPEDPRIGYVHILRFTNRTPFELDTALQEFDTVGVMALVLDLRNNNGGLLQESVDVASRFLDGGVIVYETDNQGERTLSANPPGQYLEAPVVALVNGGTASAAELVAGALQDRERAILIGQVTYGKGTVQQIFRLSDGSSIHITSAEWFTPNRQAIEGIGLQPDVSMIPDPNGADIELGEALRYLQGIIGVAENE